MNQSKSPIRIVRISLATACAIFGLTMVSCQSHTQKGAVYGGLGGAAVGAIAADDAGKGALVGGAIGAAGGAIVGNQKDKRERRAYYY